MVPRYTALVLVPLLTLLAGSGAWSWSLKRQVERRTNRLTHEIRARTRSEKRIEQFNVTLHAIRNMGQLIDGFLSGQSHCRRQGAIPVRGGCSRHSSCSSRHRAGGGKRAIRTSTQRVFGAAGRDGGRADQGTQRGAGAVGPSATAARPVGARGGDDRAPPRQDQRVERCRHRRLAPKAIDHHTVSPTCRPSTRWRTQTCVTRSSRRPLLHLPPAPLSDTNQLPRSKLRGIRSIRIE